MRFHTHLARFALGFRFAGEGIAYLVRTQNNARIHGLLTLLALLLALWLRLSATEWAVLALTIGMVWGAEAFNTAFETLVDLASPNPHPLAKIAKDVAAAGVLITACTAVAVAAFLFLPRLLS